MPDQTPLEQWVEAIKERAGAESAVYRAFGDATRLCADGNIKLVPVSRAAGQAGVMMLARDPSANAFPDRGAMFSTSDARELARALLELVGEEEPHDADSD